MLALSVILLLICMYLPSWWVKLTMRKYAKPMKELQGTGGELAQHLVERFQLQGVTVKLGEKNQNFYNPESKEVVLEPLVYKEKSITAVAVAAHEVGHAIQFSRNEPVSHLRERYMGKAIQVRRAGEIIITMTPVLGLLLKSPIVMLAIMVVGVITLLSSVLMYCAILPEEYDASFNKALPILQEGYLSELELPKARAVLKAAAYTYVAAAIAEVVSLWRWFRLMR